MSYALIAGTNRVSTCGDSAVHFTAARVVLVFQLETVTENLKLLTSFVSRKKGNVLQKRIKLPEMSDLLKRLNRFYP
jgi:hypothetical protein